MELFQNSLNDPQRLYGIKHFTEKYNITDESINLVEVPTNKIENHIAGWINTGYGKIPLFEDLGDKNYIEEKGGKIKVNFDVYTVVGKILSGHLENLTDIEKKQTAKIPIADIYEQILYDALADAKLKEGKPSALKPLWPQGRRFAVCLTHDIDEVKKTYQYATRPAKELAKGNIRKTINQLKAIFTDLLTGKNPYWTFEKMMSIEESLDVRSTSYFLQEDSGLNITKPKTITHQARKYKFSDPKITGIIKKMYEGGWEIGLHGSYNSYKNKEKLAEQKKDLENSLSQKVTGIRQHHLNLEIPNTWRLQAETGFEYDTSLGHKANAENIGFRWGTCYPFQPLDEATGREIPITQIPLEIMDTTLFQMPQDLAWEKCAEIIDTTERLGGVVTILWHNSTFSDETGDWTQFYIKLIQYCKKKDAWITTGKAVNERWREKTKQT